MKTLTKFVDFFPHKGLFHKVYIYYLTAKEFSLKIGDIFKTDENTTYKVYKYIRRRPDIKRYFSGYECVLDEGTLKGEQVNNTDKHINNIGE